MLRDELRGGGGGGGRLRGGSGGGGVLREGLRGGHGLWGGGGLLFEEKVNCLVGVYNVMTS